MVRVGGIRQVRNDRVGPSAEVVAVFWRESREDGIWIDGWSCLLQKKQLLGLSFLTIS